MAKGYNTWWKLLWKTLLLVVSTCFVKVIQAELDCGTEFEDRVAGNSYICPTQMCSNKVWGSVNYTQDSSICHAAWHDGRIIPWNTDPTRRTVKWRSISVQSVYLNSLRYGTRTISFAPNFVAVVFTSPRQSEELFDISTLLLQDGRIECRGWGNADVVNNVMKFGFFVDTNLEEVMPDGDAALLEPTFATRRYTKNFKSSFGVYSCTLKNKNNLYSQIPTVRINSSAEFIPETLTKTVSVGDSVTLQFTGNQSHSIKWRKDDREKLYDGDTLINSWNGMLNGTISDVEVGHGGVYSVYTPGNESKRGIMRLIVRGTKCL